MASALEWMRRALVALVFGLVAAALRGVVLAYFRRAARVASSPFPARGPVLLVANHPAAWTDAVVLIVLLGRKLHFVAHEPLFRPRVRGLLLRLFGALPVRYHWESEASDLNRETFQECSELFRRGEVVAIFPEGVSADDRVLQPLRSGAARLFLNEVARGASHPALIPVGIYYEDRTRFRGDLVVAVGKGIRVELPSQVTEDWSVINALTERIAAAIVGALESARLQAESFEPQDRPRRASLAWTLSAAAWLGRALHAPWLAGTQWIVRSLDPTPQQVSLANILAGGAGLLLWYAFLAGLAIQFGTSPAACLLVWSVLGLLACLHLDWTRVSAPLRPKVSERSQP